MVNRQSQPLVYVSYSHEDKEWLERLRVHLRPFEVAGRIVVWSAPDGDLWEDDVAARLDETAVAILLVSADLLGSESIVKQELPRLFERRGSLGLRVLPLLLSPATWEQVSWLREIQFFPTGAKSLAEHPPDEIDSLLAEFARRVVELAESSRVESAPTSGPGSGAIEMKKAAESSVKGPGSKAPPRKQAEAEDAAEAAAEPPATEDLQDRVPTHLDDPSAVDLLNRRPFAEVMAIRIGELWRRYETGPHRRKSFAVHIHGPWGAGKTTVLNFVKEELESGRRGKRWVTVVFNAWRHQRLKPPWWSLIREVYKQSRERLLDMPGGRSAARKLRWRWFRWRLRADWLPVVIAVALLAVVVIVVRGDLNAGIKVAATLLVAGASALAFGRSLLFGSARAAESYMALSRDPMSPIARLFQRLVGSFDQPLAIFIDDLDRCDSDYVVELLEGIQTLFRQAGVTYVVLADRKWIRSSFEQQYRGFVGAIVEPGRPLGYLFLEKMFQISAQLPRLSGGTRDDFWQGLLVASKARNVEELDRAFREAEAKAEGLLDQELSPEEMERVIAHEQDHLLRRGLRAVAAKRMSSASARERATHFLQPFARFLEANPRAMKRLVNAYGIHQSVNLLEGRQVDPGTLALWSIVEMRWPLLADCLADDPDLISEVGPKKPDKERVPPALAGLFMAPEVRRVIDGEGVAVKLTSADISKVVGSWRGSPEAAGTSPADRPAA